MCYPKDKIHYIEGEVENTIPVTMPKEIPLLRLDTDWYTSTKHELKYLFSLLSKNRILMIMDAGMVQKKLLMNILKKTK